MIIWIDFINFCIITSLYYYYCCPYLRGLCIVRVGGGGTCIFATIDLHFERSCAVASSCRRSSIVCSLCDEWSGRRPAVFAWMFGLVHERWNSRCCLNVFLFWSVLCCFLSDFALHACTDLHSLCASCTSHTNPRICGFAP